MTHIIPPSPGYLQHYLQELKLAGDSVTAVVFIHSRHSQIPEILVPATARDKIGLTEVEGFEQQLL